MHYNSLIYKQLFDITLERGERERDRRRGEFRKKQFERRWHLVS